MGKDKYRLSTIDHLRHEESLKGGLQTEPYDVPTSSRSSSQIVMHQLSRERERERRPTPDRNRGELSLPGFLYPGYL